MEGTVNATARQSWRLSRHIYITVVFLCHSTCVWHFSHPFDPQGFSASFRMPNSWAKPCTYIKHPHARSTRTRQPRKTVLKKRVGCTVLTSALVASIPYSHELTVRGRSATRPASLHHLVVEAVAAVTRPRACRPVPVMKRSRRCDSALVVKDMPKQFRLGGQHYLWNKRQPGATPRVSSEPEYRQLQANSSQQSGGKPRKVANRHRSRRQNQRTPPHVSDLDHLGPRPSPHSPCPTLPTA